ncbi:MAG: DUF4292 domain-containing protein [Bacteroidales bacterium]|jgi:hypothetical protein|nr:DUF4292 domain-containing protein [Bacteroidales bacterium]
MKSRPLSSILSPQEKVSLCRLQFRRGLTLILLLIAIISADSCRSHRKATTPAPVEDRGVYTSCYPIESISVPSCNLEISDGGKSYSLSGNIYIRPDSICYFRGRLVVEVMRGVIYRDSFVVVNYLDRVCYKGKNEYLQKVTGYPVNPESLMMLFTADRCEETYRNKFNFIVAAGKSDKIMMQGKSHSLLEMNINTDDHTIEDIALYNGQQRKALFSATYGGYNQYSQFILPTIFDISAHNGKRPIRIKANFQQILFNQPQQVNMSIPSKYKVVVLQ